MIKYLITVLASLSFVCCACNKETGTETKALANLTFTAVPATDNSGNVTFTAKAGNAVDYEFDFGNGVFKSEPGGTTVYKYPAGGIYTVKVTAKNAAGQKLSKTIENLTVNVAMRLVWSDEFETAGKPNASKWGYDIGNGSDGWGNQEKQYYTDRQENAFVSNGTLKIVAIKEPYQGYNYTSARLLTKGKFSVQYGKIEMKAKLPTGIGVWPAFWMLGDNISTVGWPACGEIDIMEFAGKTPTKIFGTLHYTGRSGGNADGGTTNVNGVQTDFHIYAVEWNAEALKFSVDGNVFFTRANSSTLPFNAKHFIILNMAMGGSFTGEIDPAVTGATYEIDYVRVYQ